MPRPESQSAPKYSEALELAGILLRNGFDVSQVEQRLVARGLLPESAKQIVQAALEDRVRTENASVKRRDTFEELHWILSSLVACALLFGDYRLGDTTSALLLLVFLSVPLACIWLPEWIEMRLHDWVPASMIRWGGWLALFAVGTLNTWVGGIKQLIDMHPMP
jgi:hypothetical protein